MNTVEHERGVLMKGFLTRSDRAEKGWELLF